MKSAEFHLNGSNDSQGVQSPAPLALMSDGGWVQEEVLFLPPRIPSRGRAATSRPRASRLGHDISNVLLKDHQLLKKHIAVLKGDKHKIPEKRKAYGQFLPLLTTHASAEEQSLHYCMKTSKNMRLEGLEGDTEHAIFANLIKEIERTQADDELWLAKVNVLASLVENHIHEVENVTLKKLEAEFDLTERVLIGEQYARLVAEFRAVKSKPVRSRLQVATALIQKRVVEFIWLCLVGAPGLVAMLAWLFYLKE